VWGRAGIEPSPPSAHQAENDEVGRVDPFGVLCAGGACVGGSCVVELTGLGRGLGKGTG
jgi:hypothetical protein